MIVDAFELGFGEGPVPRGDGLDHLDGAHEIAFDQPVVFHTLPKGADRCPVIVPGAGLDRR